MPQLRQNLRQEKELRLIEIAGMSPNQLYASIEAIWIVPLILRKRARIQLADLFKKRPPSVRTRSLELIF